MSRSQANRPKPSRRHQRGADYARDLMREVCRIAGTGSYLKQIRHGLTRAGIRAAVTNHDTPALYDWLIEAVSFQGVSDAVAWAYMEEHGRIQWADIGAALRRRPSCPRLSSYAAVKGCRYAKASGTCAEPGHRPACPLPGHDLRKGALNQAAYALYLFLRDECRGDLVAWIDARLAEADLPEAPDRGARMRQALLEPLGSVHGVGPKVLSMALAQLLLGGDPGRERWVVTGASMVAIDTLVHNWLHRTGILRRLGAEHAYGPGCYRPGGCAQIIEEAAQAIDARTFHPSFPQPFPRFVQSAIWRFCARDGLGICNGVRIDDRRRCGNRDCGLFALCDRQVLRPEP